MLHMSKSAKILEREPKNVKEALHSITLAMEYLKARINQLPAEDENKPTLERALKELSKEIQIIAQVENMSHN